MTVRGDRICADSTGVDNRRLRNLVLLVCDLSDQFKMSIGIGVSHYHREFVTLMFYLFTIKIVRLVYSYTIYRPNPECASCLLDLLFCASVCKR